MKNVKVLVQLESGSFINRKKTTFILENYNEKMIPPQPSGELSREEFLEYFCEQINQNTNFNMVQPNNFMGSGGLMGYDIIALPTPEEIRNMKGSIESLKEDVEYYKEKFEELEKKQSESGDIEGMMGKLMEAKEIQGKTNEVTPAKQ